MKNLIILALLSVTVFVISCSGDSETAKVQVALIDAPGAYEEVNIEILEVTLNTNADTSGWMSLESASTGIFDVIKLTNGEEAFLGEVELPEGRLSQIRLLLGDNNTLVVDGETEDLNVTSGTQSGLKLNVNADIEAGITYKLVLDFDVSKSIVLAGNSGKYNLKPVIRAHMEAQTGAIAGTVSPVEADAVIYAIADGDSISTYPDATGAFTIRALEAGTYDVLAQVADTTLYQNQTQNDVQVEVGIVTNMDALDVSK
jgi:hypothetical protein